MLTVDLMTSKVSDLGGARVTQRYLPGLGNSLFEKRRYNARSVFVGIVMLWHMYQIPAISVSIRCCFRSFILQQGIADPPTFIGRCTMATNDLHVDCTRLLVVRSQGGRICFIAAISNSNRDGTAAKATRSPHKKKRQQEPHAPKSPRSWFSGL